MALERTFQSALRNSAKYFAGWGLASFSCAFVAVILRGWMLARRIVDGPVSSGLEQPEAVAISLLSAGATVMAVIAACEFLRRIYRVRKFLSEASDAKFPSWPVTLLAFGVPLANFFVPWNRLDTIRASLRAYREGSRSLPTPLPEKKLRTVGIAWGVMSLIAVRGEIESVSWMSMVLAIDLALVVLSFWSFSIAARWLSELQSDFEAVTT